jgi:sugar O-acyltransferase (sialic acid O-acetyltransferase NeuD family)
MSGLVIFGCGQIAQTAAHYAEAWGIGDVVAFAVDPAYRDATTCLGRPVVTTDALRDAYPPDRHRAFVAVGYQELNALRARTVARLRDWGYTLPSIVNPTARALVTTGANCLVIPGESCLEPFVTLGTDVFVWNAVSLSHFVTIGDHSWLSNGTVLGGNVVVGPGSFLGLGVTVNNRVTIGAGCLVGSGALVTRDLADGQALIPRATPPSPADARIALALLR